MRHNWDWAHFNFGGARFWKLIAINVTAFRPPHIFAGDRRMRTDRRWAARPDPGCGKGDRAVRGGDRLMPVMAVAKFERFFRLAAGLDVDAVGDRWPWWNPRIGAASRYRALSLRTKLLGFGRSRLPCFAITSSSPSQSRWQPPLAQAAAATLSWYLSPCGSAWPRRCARSCWPSRAARRWSAGGRAGR